MPRARPLEGRSGQGRSREPSDEEACAGKSCEISFHARNATTPRASTKGPGENLWVPELALAGQEMLTTATPILAASPLRAVLLVLVILLEVVLGLWSFVLFLKCLGEVHGFSAWKSLAAVLLALLAILLLALIVALPIALVAAVA